MSRTIKEQRKYMWLKNPHCCYCGCLTVLPETLPIHSSTNGNIKIKNFPDNTATIEHFNSRLTLIRDKLNNTRTRALACRKCNQDKSAEEVAALKEIWSELSKEPSLQKRKQMAHEYLMRAKDIKEVHDTSP